MPAKFPEADIIQMVKRDSLSIIHFEVYPESGRVNVSTRETFQGQHVRDSGFSFLVDLSKDDEGKFNNPDDAAAYEYVKKYLYGKAAALGHVPKDVVIS